MTVSAIVLAAGDRARELRERPAWITGFEHRIETPVLGARDLTTSPSRSGYPEKSAQYVVTWSATSKPWLAYRCASESLTGVPGYM